MQVLMLGSEDAIDWPRMAQLLSSPAFKRLSTVTVKVNLWTSIKRSPDMVESVIRGHLSQLEERGMLRLQVISPIR